MPRRKRPYDPKIKGKATLIRLCNLTTDSQPCVGCLQCARRRIHCDLRGPRCRKCESRDLTCTGLALELQTDGLSGQRSHSDVFQLPYR